MNQLAILGVGNILEYDDAIAIYATTYLEKNFIFEPKIKIINGGVEGINLLNMFMEHQHIIILDAIEIDDKAGSIYHIPSHELTGYGLNSGGAHEIGVLQCFDILELMGKDIPRSSVIGIVPQEIKVSIGLSETMLQAFNTYIETTLKIISQNNIKISKKNSYTRLEKIIEDFQNPQRK